MNAVTLIGIDLGKHSFHLHAQDRLGRMVFRKKLSRQQLLRTLANVPACRVVMEACAERALETAGKLCAVIRVTGTHAR